MQLTITPLAISRLSFGFSSPLDAAILIAIAVPSIFGAFLLARRNGTCIVSVGLAVILLGAIVLIVLTGSRGPLVALAAAAGYSAFLPGHVLPFRRAQFLRYTLLVAIVAAFSILVTSQRRMLPSAFADDGSLRNRWTLMKGGVALLRVTPWWRETTVNAGDMFSQWISPPELDYEYASILCSYLEGPIEHGKVVLVIVTTLTMLFALLPISISARCELPFARKMMGYVSNATVVIILALSSYNSIIRPGVIAGVAIAACGCLVICWWPGMLWRRILLSGSLSAGISLLALAVLPGNETVRISAAGVALSSMPERSGRSAAFLVDRELMGHLYGRTIRMWRDISGCGAEWYVASPDRKILWAEVLHRDVVVLVGRAAKYYDTERMALAGKLVVLVFPMGDPPTTEGRPLANVIIVRPRFDELALSEKWIAAIPNCKVITAGDFREGLRRSFVDLGI